MRLRYAILFSGISILFLLSGCGGDAPEITDEQSTAKTSGSSVVSVGSPTEDSPVPEPATAPAVTAEPTSVPTPEPTNTPIPTDTPDPTAGFVSFESPEGGFSLRYPADWTAEEFAGLAMIASSQAILDAPDSNVEGGLMVVTSGPTADLDSDFETRDPVEIVNSGFDDLGFGDNLTLVDQPQAATINGNPAATAHLSMTADDGTPLKGYMTVIIGEPNTVVAFGASPEDGADPYLALFAAISQTIEIFEPEVVDVPGQDSDALVQESKDVLLFGDTVTSKLAAGERAVWTILPLEGETLNITVTPLTDTLDVVVDVVDDSGQSILSGGPLDASFSTEEITGLPILTTGPYYIIVSGLDDTASGAFEIAVNNGSPGPTTDADYELTYFGGGVEGTIENEGESVAIPFSGQEGDIAMVYLDVYDDLDASVDIVGPDGQSLVPEGNDNSDFYEVVGARLPADGEYKVVVTAVFGSGDFEAYMDGPAGTYLTGSATLDPAGDEDSFPFTAVGGDLVFMIVKPDGDFPFYAAVYDEKDDEEIYGLDYSDYAFGEEIPDDGDYYFTVETLDSDGDGNVDGGGTYNFTIIGSGSTLFELAAYDRVQGKFNGDDSNMTYLYSAQAGETLFLTLDTAPDGDAVIEIRDSNGDTLVSADEFFNEGETLTYTFAVEDLVTIWVSDFNGGSGYFNLALDPG